MRFISLDLEHNGGGSEGVHITEVAAIEFDERGHRTPLQLTMLVNPGAPINSFVRRLTHITYKMVRDKSTEANAALAFRAFAEGAMLIGHNVKGDLSKLAAFDPSIANMPAFDTQRIVEAMFPKKRFPHQRYGLDNLIIQFGKPSWHVRPHRAWSDAVATGRLFFALRDYCETKLAPDELAALRQRFSADNISDTRGKFFHEVVRAPEAPDLQIPQPDAAPKPLSPHTNTLHLGGGHITFGNWGLAG